MSDNIINVTWPTIKQFVDNRKLSIQWVDEYDKYYLRALDGFFILSCTLSKSTDTDLVSDFETNYKDNGNLSPAAQVVTQFEKRDKTLKLAHCEGDVTGDGSVSVLLKIPGTPGSGDGRWISSGTAFFDVHTPGDKVVGVYFTDEDNLLGNGAGSIIGSYTDDETPDLNKGWAMSPVGWVKCEAIGGYGFAPSGFYIKINAIKAGDSPSGKFYCNIEWGKVE